MPDITSLTPRQPGSIAQADVPSDIWLEIIVHLESPDVLSLQSTGKLLRDTPHKRSVWISVLQRGCSRDGVYFPSYPVTEMDIRRLQRAALAPYRLYRLVESCSAHSSDPPQLNPVSNTLINLTTPSVEPATPSVHWQQVAFLVPGGRYLLTGGTFALYLWDLGPPDRLVSADSTLVARVVIQSNPSAKIDGWTRISARILPDDTLRIALAVGGLMITVYDIDPCRPSPAFRSIATLLVNSTGYPCVDQSCTALSLSDDVVLFVVGMSYRSLAWNFSEGWHGFGPKRSFIAFNHVITSVNMVIECDNVTAAIWSAERDSLHTWPVKRCCRFRWRFDPESETSERRQVLGDSKRPSVRDDAA